MLIKGKEINLLPKRLAVEIYWQKKAEDIMSYGSLYYEPFDLALMIWASAANWSKVNLQPKQIEFEDVLEWIDGELSDDAKKQITDFCTEFVDSNFYKEKVEKIAANVEEVKKKMLTGESLESVATNQESTQNSTTESL